MKKYLLALVPVILLMLPGQALAQSKVMSGVVSDRNNTLQGATVYLQNKDERIITGVVTGAQGEYLINIPQNSTGLTIVVAFVGYQTVKVPYTGQEKYNVRLQDDAQQIGDVVVTGRAIDRNNMGVRREDVGAATQKIDVTEFEDMGVSSIEDILQGRMASLDIVAGGDPGSVGTIRIRGTASLSGNSEPLIVIDGIPQDNDIDDDFNFGDATVEDFGSLININPNDIQSIEILKDAAATATWGPRAANGVILIETKKGGNYKPRFSFSQKLDFKFEPKAMAMLNGAEYVTLMQDALWNWVRDGGYPSGRINTMNSYRDILYDRSYEYFNEFNQDTDWLDLITGNSVSSNSVFTMSGGGDKANYYFSVGYNKDNGTLKGADSKLFTSTLKVGYIFSSKFTVNAKFGYTERTNNSPYSDDGSFKSIRNISLRKMPNMSPWLLDADGNPTDEYFTQPSSSIQGNMAHPVAWANESMDRTLIRKIETSFSGEYKLLPGLSVRGTLGFDLITNRNNKFLPASVLDIKWANDNYNRGRERRYEQVHTYANITIQYIKEFQKKHRIQLTFADDLESSNNSAYFLITAGNGGQGVSLPSAGGKIVKMESEWNKKRTLGLVGSAHYKYKDLYAITFAGRANANSNAGGIGKWRSPVPSISGVWNLNNEEFLKKVSQINVLRLRGSWGKSDRVPERANASRGTFAYENEYMDLSALKPNKMQLNNLKPEMTTQTNIGLDMTFLKRKIDVSVDIYDKKTTDLLQEGIAIQSTTGYAQARFFNSGSLRNRGLELIFNFNNILEFGKVKISFKNVNIARNVNKILEMPENLESEIFTLGNGNYAKKILVGNPLGAIYGFRADGVYQNYDETLARDANGNRIRDINGNYVPVRIGGTWRQRPGDARYVDMNYDGVIDEYDIVYLGNSYPTLTGGGSLNVNWNRFLFRASVHFRLGHSIINDVKHATEKMMNGDNQSKTTLSRWRYEGDNTDIPRALWQTNYNSLGSDRFVEDGSFLKLKDITVTYNLPDKALSRIGFTKASVSLSAYNLLTFTNYSGQDPEVGIQKNKGAFALAVDESRTPPTRRFTFTFSCNF